MNPDQKRHYDEALRLRARAASAVTDGPATRLLLEGLLSAVLGILARDIEQPYPGRASDGKREVAS